jgi:hypothetical protein
MAANTGSTNSGKRNYYNVSYGKISTKQKEIPQDFTEIAEADLKSKVQAVEQVDLRKKYVNKGTGDYPYSVFYDSLTGVIQAQEKHENDNGTNLNLTILDSDGDTSILQVKFYSKYTENLLNRLLNVDTTKEFNFMPYAIANTADINGKNVKFYTQGVSLKTDGNKVEPKYKNDNPDLPPTEQIKVQGKETTSRDKRLDFLYEEFVKHFTPSTATSAPQQKSEAPKIPVATPAQAFEPATNYKEEEHDDLPF